MHYRQFRQEIQQGDIRPFYFIFGEDDYLFTEGLKELREAYLSGGGEAAYLEDNISFKKVAGFARGGDIFSPRKLLVLKNPLFLNSKAGDGEEELVLAYAKKPVSDVCLVIYASQVDKRRRFFKTLVKEKQAYNFSPYKGRDLAAWAKERARLLKKEISPAALEYLLMCTAENMTHIAGELDKAALFLGEEKTISREVLERLVSCSVNVSIFSLVDCLGDQKKGEGLFLLQEMLSQGEPALKTLFMISRQFQLLYRIRALLDDGIPSRELPRHMSLPPFVMSKLTQQVEKFTRAELARALTLVRDTDLAIKTGKKAPGLALELLLLKL
jgi:DNA polymerase III subunit delta